jgi:membrane-associated protease RseP (regulator of RpoE activity)
MEFIEGLMIFLSVLSSYFVIVLILNKTGFLKKNNISLFGPALMWRTEKGKKFIDWIASINRFWNIYANAGIFTCFIVMILMLLLLITILPLTFTVGETVVSQNPQLAIGLPGINPLIPLWYGILGLLVALLVHEFSHGILVRAGKLKVKSLGLLLFIVPIGAFCEPDEEELKKTSIRKRMRVFAAGPTSNIVTAFLCLGLISLFVFAFVQPAADGISVIAVMEDSPAEEIGIIPGTIITNVNNSEIETFYDFVYEMNQTKPYQTVNISYFYNNEHFDKTVTLSKRGWNGSLNVSVTNPPKDYINLFINPFTYFPLSFISYIGFPINSFADGFSPISPQFTSHFFTINSFIPEDIFWIIINCLYWIFWINFMVATFNVLPMIPLDGGYMFRDLIDGFLRKVKTNLAQEKREKIAQNITTIISLFILFVVLAPIIIPNIMKFF